MSSFVDRRAMIFRTEIGLITARVARDLQHSAVVYSITAVKVTAGWLPDSEACVFETLSIWPTMVETEKVRPYGGPRPIARLAALALGMLCELAGKHIINRLVHLSLRDNYRPAVAHRRLHQALEHAVRASYVPNA